MHDVKDVTEQRQQGRDLEARLESLAERITRLERRVIELTEKARLSS